MYGGGPAYVADPVSVCESLGAATHTDASRGLSAVLAALFPGRQPGRRALQRGERRSLPERRAADDVGGEPVGVFRYDGEHGDNGLARDGGRVCGGDSNDAAGSVKKEGGTLETMWRDTEKHLAVMEEYVAYLRRIEVSPEQCSRRDTAISFWEQRIEGWWQRQKAKTPVIQS